MSSEYSHIEVESPELYVQEFNQLTSALVILDEEQEEANNIDYRPENIPLLRKHYEKIQHQAQRIEKHCKVLLDLLSPPTAGAEAKVVEQLGTWLEGVTEEEEAKTPTKKGKEEEPEIPKTPTKKVEERVEDAEFPANSMVWFVRGYVTGESFTKDFVSPAEINSVRASHNGKVPANPKEKMLEAKELFAKYIKDDETRRDNLKKAYFKAKPKTLTKSPSKETVSTPTKIDKSPMEELATPADAYIFPSNSMHWFHEKYMEGSDKIKEFFDDEHIQEAQGKFTRITKTEVRKKEEASYLWNKYVKADKEMAMAIRDAYEEAKHNFSG